MLKSSMFWQKYLRLENKLLDIADNIFITDVLRTTINGIEQITNNDNQLLCYSPKICDFIIECCVEIESIAKELYCDNYGEINKKLHFDYDCLEHFEAGWHINEKIVNVISPFFELRNDDNYRIKPLYRNVKDEKGKLKTIWNVAYQAIKHDRYNSLNKGTIKAAYYALAALYLLNIYLKNINIIIKYSNIDNYDFTFGSKVFSIDKPIDNKQLFYNNVIVHSSSPLVYKYTDLAEKVLKEKQENDKRNRINWIQAQPEFLDEKFNKEVEEEMNNPLSKKHDWSYVCFIIEQRHRINIMSSNTFEEQKSKLVNTKGWRLYLQNNKEINNNSITKDNLNEMIIMASIQESINIENSFRTSGWEYLSQEYACNLMIDKYQ